MRKREQQEKDSEIIELALERYKNGFPDTINREQALDDLKMLNGENHWNEDIVTQRELTRRPCLVINRLPSFLDRITGDQKKNKAGINLSPANNEANKDIANIIEGLIRDIQYQSKASNIYDYAFSYAAGCGFGFFRFLTQYENDKSFNQVIRMKHIKNPFSVTIDPAAKGINYIDMNWAFISEYINKKEFEKMYLDKGNLEFTNQQGEMYEGWYFEDKIKLTEYWVREKKTKRILFLSNGETVDDLWLRENKDYLNIMQLEVLKERTAEQHKVKQYIMTASDILEENEWAGKYIPIVPVLGKSLNIDGKMIYRGIIRHAKDSQRMYDYWRSAATEVVQNAPKASHLMTPEQVRGHETMWNQSITNPKGYVLYNYIPNQQPPIRNSLDNVPQGIFTEINGTIEDIKATIGFDNMPLVNQEVSSKTFGMAYQAGGITQYEFVDNLNIAIEHGGCILLDLIPHIYDSQRDLVIKNREDNDMAVTVNKKENSNQITNDITSGEYNAVINVGPNWTTQRHESAYEMGKLLQVMPQEARLFLDIFAEHLDWPGAEKLARRFKKGLPPELQEDENGEPLPMPLQQPDPKAMAEMKKYDVEEKRLLVELERIKMELDKIYSQNITDKKELRTMMIEVMKEVFKPEQ